MNVVEITITVKREGTSAVGIMLARKGHGDDIVESHAAFIESIVAGGLSGLFALRGSPTDETSGDGGVKAGAP